jgi:hypothetical protein
MDAAPGRTRAKSEALVATLFFTATFFSLGEAAFEAHVNYPAWLLIGDGSFRDYHRAITARIGFLLVPLAASLVLNLLLLWRRPPAIPRWSVWATLALQLVAWASAVLIQIPIQAQLSEGGYSRELIERLIRTDFAYRKVPGYLRLVLASWMLYRVATPDPRAGLRPGA